MCRWEHKINRKLRKYAKAISAVIKHLYKYRSNAWWDDANWADEERKHKSECDAMRTRRNRVPQWGRLINNRLCPRLGHHARQCRAVEGRQAADWTAALHSIISPLCPSHGKHTASCQPACTIVQSGLDLYLASFGWEHTQTDLTAQDRQPHWQGTRSILRLSLQLVTLLTIQFGTV